MNTTTNTPAATLDIGVDLDGCVHLFVEEYADWLHLSEGRCHTKMPAPLVWEFYKDQWGMTTQEFLATYAEGVRAGYIFRTRAPDPAGLDVLTRLAGQGHRLHVITSRRLPGAEAEAEAATAWWLAEHNVPHHSLNVLAGPKAERALELGIDIAIDDAVHHYDELDDAGCNPYLYTRAYNTHRDGRRVDNWYGFEAAVNELAATRT